MKYNQNISPYFEVQVSIKKGRDGTWIGRIRFKRKDTGEEIGCGKTISENTRAALDSSITKEIMLIIQSMPRPVDWKSKIRKILLRYLRLRNRITQFGEVMDKLELHSIETNEADQKYIKFWNDLIDETIAIVREINVLNETEKCEILISKKEAFENPMDPWNLDDIISRQEIFRYFLAPTVEQKKLHEKQVKKMKEAFKKG